MTGLQGTEGFRNAPKQPEALRDKQAKYYATIARIDQNIGRLMATLDELGLASKTIVVFTSSQGFSTGENGLWGSGPVFWDTFIHCPLVIRPARMGPSASAPATAPGLPLRIAQAVTLVDVAPTLMELAGLPVPLTMQGRSLCPMLDGKPDRDRPEECFVEYESQNNQQFPARVILAGQYKLVDYLQGADQFFDHKRDPNEQRNIAEEPAYAAVVKVLRARLDTWRRRTRDSAAR